MYIVRSILQFNNRKFGNVCLLLSILIFLKNIIECLLEQSINVQKLLGYIVWILVLVNNFIVRAVDPTVMIRFHDLKEYMPITEEITKIVKKYYYIEDKSRMNKEIQDELVDLFRKHNGKLDNSDGKYKIIFSWDELAKYYL